MPEIPLCSAPRKLTEERFLNLFVVEIERPAKRSKWIFASRKPAPTPGQNTADAAVVVAVVVKDGRPHLVLTREFRAPLGALELSLPSGLIDPGESATTAAQREFLEETGMTLSRVTHVSPALASSAGLTDETVCLVFGEASGVPSRNFQTEHEDIEIVLADLSDLKALLKAREVVISSRLYPLLLGYLQAGKIALPEV